MGDGGGGGRGGERGKRGKSAALTSALYSPLIAAPDGKQKPPAPTGRPALSNLPKKAEPSAAATLAARRTPSCHVPSYTAPVPAWR